MTHAGLTPVVVTDPPFNIGYRYKGFTDRMDEGDCYAMLAEVTAQTAAVAIHYPEQLHRSSIEKGEGARLYDWWNVNQVKNVSKVKTGHPCQMPIQVMKNIIGILPDGIGAIDPFLGSGTTAVASFWNGRANDEGGN